MLTMLKEQFGKSNELRKVVVYFGGFRLPDKNAAAHRVVSNAKILVSLGYDVILVGHGETDKLTQINCGIEGITMYVQPYPISNKEWINYIFGTALIKKMCIKYYATHLIMYNYPSFAQIRLLFFLKKKKIKLIADVTEWYMHTKGKYIMRTVKQIDTYLRMNWVNHLNSGNIVISTYLQNKYEKVPSLLLPPLIDLKDDKWQTLGANVNDNRPLEFIYAGQLGGVKDRLDVFVRVLSEIKKKNSYTDFRVNIVGITKEEYIEKIGTEVYDFMLFHGQISHIEAITLVKKADFSVFFRDTNRVNTAGFPTKFVESITCGTPVITNRTSDIGHYLLPNHNGFIIEPKEEIISQKLEEVLAMSRKEIDEMKGYCFHNNPFDIQHYVKEVEKFMNSL